MSVEALDEIKQFLGCETPSAWLDFASNPDHLELLLTDHAHCEKKAASTAMRLMFRYVDRPELLHKMSRLAREELIHFDQVLKLMNQRGLTYHHLEASAYAGGMRAQVRTSEPESLIDVLIVGAFIEARSCERFAALAPLLDDELQSFYTSLLRSEGRHYQDYLHLARSYSAEPIDARIALFREVEAQLIQRQDPLFRFHSGVPAPSLVPGQLG